MIPQKTQNRRTHRDSKLVVVTEGTTIGEAWWKRQGMSLYDFSQCMQIYNHLNMKKVNYKTTNTGSCCCPSLTSGQNPKSLPKPGRSLSSDSPPPPLSLLQPHASLILGTSQACSASEPLHMLFSLLHTLSHAPHILQLSPDTSCIIHCPTVTSRAPLLPCCVGPVATPGP